jgi:DNA-binding transcriptional LysR family regulator
MRYLIAVADAGSLTKAAEMLGVAQPALSQALTRMENGLGVRLFTRSRRGAELTLAGQAIIEDVRSSIARAEVATLKAKAIGAGRSGRLTVAFVTQAVYEALPRALRVFHAELPEVDVILREMSNAEQVAALEKGTIDIGLLHTPISINGKMNEKMVRRDRFIAAVPLSFPVADDGKVSLSEIARKGLVWFPKEQLPVVQTEILSAFRRAGHEIRVTQEANRALSVLACVAAELGTSLLPESVRALNHAGVRYAEIRDPDHLPYFELSAIWPARSRPTFADRFAATLETA